jgi:hypothetical protein
LLLPQRQVGSGNLSGVQLRPTNDFKDKFVAPEISSFTEASISDLSGLQERWLVSFILNSSLVVQLDDATRRTIYNFLRRAEAAFREYSSARQMTLAHLANPNPDAVSEYIIAIGHWEVFLSQAYQAWCLLARGRRSSSRQETVPRCSDSTCFTTAPSTLRARSQPSNCHRTGPCLCG